MDHSGRDVDVDLEAGCKCGEEGLTNDATSGNDKEVKFSGNVCEQISDSRRPVKGDDGLNIHVNMRNLDGAETVKMIMDKKLEGEGTPENARKEKLKKTSNKKAPKPPRPPRGPSLDAADQKLIKEIAELAMLKRARIERMKALKKGKNAKASSCSNNNVIAIVFTALFILVVLFQGTSPRTKSSMVTFDGSPESAGSPLGNLISVQYKKNPSINDLNGPSYVSPSLVEEFAGSSAEEKSKRVAG